MAGSLNRVFLIGRLGNDPKLAYLPSGQPVAEMSVATDESYKDRDGNKVEKTEWHRVKVFGRSAEFCGQYLGKGRLVYIEGCLRTRKWQKDGQDHYSTEIVVSAPGHTIKALDRGQDRDDAAGGQGERRDTPARNRGERRGNAAHDDDTGPAFPSEASGMDDVPF